MIMSKDQFSMPTSIKVKHYNQTIKIETDHSDVNLEELHDMWMSVVRAMGYAEGSIKEYYG